MTNYVLDTSVVVKWFSQTDEDDVSKALQFRQDYLDKEIRILVPDLFMYETANVLRYKPDFNEDKVKRALKSLQLMKLEVCKYQYKIGDIAIKLAFKYNLAIYDSYFMALSQMRECIFVTADEKAYRKTKDLPNIKLLRDL